MENIPIVNEQDEIISEADISKVHKKGLWHREAYTYLISHHEVLLQKRLDDGMWDHSSAGHFSSDETYIQGAQREFKEELGIDLSINNFVEIGYEKLLSKHADKINNRFVRIFLVKKDIPIEKFKVDKKEVEEIRFFSKSELKTFLSSKEKIKKNAKYIIHKYILNRL